MSEHTPGPWTVGEWPNKPQGEDSMFVAPELGGDCDSICVVTLPRATVHTAFGLDRKIQRANAELIARAPTMMEELAAKDAEIARLQGEVSRLCREVSREQSLQFVLRRLLDEREVYLREQREADHAATDAANALERKP